MRNIFIHGIESLLGSYFAAICLRSSDDCVIFSGISSEKMADLVVHAASQIAAGEASLGVDLKVGDRLRQIKIDSNGHPESVFPEAVWWFTSAQNEPEEAETLDRLFALYGRDGMKELNYVPFDCAGAKLHEMSSGQEMLKHCEARHIRYRMCPVSLVLGNGLPGVQCEEVLTQFLSALLVLKDEIEERSPQYFDFHALRYFAAKDASVNMVSAGIAAALLARLPSADAASAFFPMYSAEKTRIATLCESIGMACNLSLLAVGDMNALNAIDRVFEEQVADLAGALLGQEAQVAAVEDPRTANCSKNLVLSDEQAGQLFNTIRQDLDRELALRKRRADGLPARLTRKSIKRDNGELVYYLGGTGATPVIVLNALGQGLKYWHRLLDHLIENHRIIIWEPRGTVDPLPPFGISDQVDDLDAVVRHEQIESCRLVCWCTGPKVGVKFYLRHPSIVNSMVFLNASFKCDGNPEDLNSPYENNMESLCRILVRKPAMASSVMNTLKSRVEESEAEALEISDKEKMSAGVLALMNTHLKCSVMEPFRSEQTTINYAHQLVNFWSEDVRPHAATVKVPVLLISTEYDQIATPAASVEATRLFPIAQHVHVKGATHYCLYDRSEFVAGLLITFFANAGAPSVSHCKHDEEPQSVQSFLDADKPATTFTTSSRRTAYGS